MEATDIISLIDHRISGLLAHNELTDEQLAEHDRLVSERDRLTNQSRMSNRRTQPNGPENMSGSVRSEPRPAEVWRDQDGRAVALLDPGQSYAEFARSNSETASTQERLSLGRAVVGAITGDWRHAQKEMHAMSTHAGGGGHWLIPAELSAELIDLARAKTVCIAAGARTIPMSSDRLTMARVLSDPDLQFKAENARFDGSDVTFGAIGFTSRTIGQTVTMSRELAQDAPNAPEIIEHTLAEALAVKLDRLALVGTGSAEFAGLSVHADVGKTESVGAIDWLDLHSGVVGIQKNNGQPNAYIASPTIAGDLATLTTGDGTNAAKTWLGPPATVARITPHTTTGCPDDKLFIGDFTQLVFAIRQSAEIAISDVAGEAFDRNQIKLRITWRGDIGLLRPTHFHRLEGITS